MVKNGLFIFHRDFRIHDNVGLTNAAKDCDKLYTCFVFTNEQVVRNSYKSKNSVQFLIESLKDLSKQISGENGKLIVLHDSTINALKQLINTLNIDGLYFNEDYTPYAKKRIEDIEKLCKKEEIECNSFHDYCMNEPGSILNGSGKIYVKFTPFYEKVLLETEFKTPSKYKISNLTKTTKKLTNSITLDSALEKFVGNSNENIAVNGGRTLGLVQLKDAAKRLKKYDETRDTMSEDTSMLSAYIKYGCVSIREVLYEFYKKYGKLHEFIRQLIWRDFYMHILDAYPDSLGKFHGNLYKNFSWSSSNSYLNAWKNGKTGFPLVDAGMRQMNETGYMHNRCRMIVATFLSKILMVDWREGEKYFAQELVDYDVASNSGNWQAVVGGGHYSMPYFRVLSPWAQSDKNDPDCEYIKKWVPELKDVENKHIHKWYKYYKKNNDVNYPKPIVDFDKQQEKYLTKMKS